MVFLNRSQKYRRLSLFLPARFASDAKGQTGFNLVPLDCIISSLSIFLYVTAKKFTALATGTLHRFRLPSSRMIAHCFNIIKINPCLLSRTLNIIHVIFVTHWHANVASWDSYCLIYARPIRRWVMCRVRLILNFLFAVRTVAYSVVFLNLHSAASEIASWYQLNINNAIRSNEPIGALSICGRGLWRIGSWTNGNWSNPVFSIIERSDSSRLPKVAAPTWTHHSVYF